ncbi:MAG: CBS domain-containing protein, partial [Pseudomonadota bacterium]
MGDASDGSSNAAQSAQHDEAPGSRQEDPPQTAGLFSRLVSAITGSDETPPPEDRPEPALVNGEAMPLGLGNLRRMRVEDVMLPKAEIISVPADIKKDDLVALFRDSGLTRLPVYKGTLDTPTGMVHLKDFALSHGFNGGGGRFNLVKMLRPLLFAPPSMPIGVLLQKMQSDRTHMALVIDEYGGVDGLVTIEDLVEEIVGEIEDEHDEYETSQ